ncbi:GNAT family N-acetyltransferase [Lysobacter sp. K5869]|uniref:GNAT family N-acetyltransferase n=1 Tax=Lysobacter sp. K5869 TaxID=2820808 RepID=UPI001C05F4D8|nr:GNAT family N-acetyltransferase [Lysobacter sp. K5869]QWP79230.1 GNAT family N-acetyltransferase [Lysobacter sp. K5869]
MDIRKAEAGDIPAIVGMGADFYPSTPYAAAGIPFCPVTVEAIARLMQENGILLVADDGRRLVGMVGLVLAPFMFNGAYRTAHEVMWWCDPAAQGAGVGKALLAAVDAAAKAAGAFSVQMLHLVNSPPQAAALYERLGYAHSETCFTKRID